MRSAEYSFAAILIDGICVRTDARSVVAGGAGEAPPAIAVWR